MQRVVFPIIDICLTSFLFCEVSARGVHSTYLFIICIELLSYKITTTGDITALHIRNTSLKILLFADDASSILDGSTKSFEALVDVLEYYSYISGLKLN